MRLIDAEGEYVIEASDNTGYKIECKNGIVLLSNKYGQVICKFMIDSIPTAFDVDNIINQFREQIKENAKIHSLARFEWLAALEIVKAELESK